jgi:hypothetical protein
MIHHARLGGTAIAALMGEDSFGKTPRDIYNRIIKGYSGVSTIYTRRGLALESEVRRRYVDEQNATIEPHPGVQLWGECFAASVDDLRERNGVKGVVDYKTASASAGSLRKWKDGMLPSYEWQLRLYMPIFSRDESDLFVAFGIDLEGAEAEARPDRERFIDEDGMVRAFEIVDTRLFTVHRDEEKERRIIAVGTAFWREHILPKIPPPGATPEAPPPASTRIAHDETLSGAELEQLEGGFDEVNP